MRLKHWSRDLCAISNCHGLSCLPFHSLQRFEHLILCWFCIQQNLDCCKAIQYHVQWHTVAPMTWLCPTSPQHTQPSWFWFHTWAFCTDTVEIRSRWQSANLELHNFIRITKTNTLSVCCSPCSNPNRNPRAYAGVSCSSASCCDKQHASSHFFGQLLLVLQQKFAERHTLDEKFGPRGSSDVAGMLVCVEVLLCQCVLPAKRSVEIETHLAQLLFVFQVHLAKSRNISGKFFLFAGRYIAICHLCNRYGWFFAFYVYQGGGDAKNRFGFHALQIVSVYFRHGPLCLVTALTAVW